MQPEAGKVLINAQVKAPKLGYGRATRGGMIESHG